MKIRIFALCLALFCAATSFTGCSKDDDGTPSGAESYSGALLGVWESSHTAYDQKFTFKSNGTYTCYVVESNSVWYEESGNYYVKDDKTLALLATTSKSESGSVYYPDEYQYIVYYYISSVDATDMTIASIAMGDQGNTTADFDSMQDLVDSYDENPDNIDVQLDRYTKQ